MRSINIDDIFLPKSCPCANPIRADICSQLMLYLSSQGYRLESDGNAILFQDGSCLIHFFNKDVAGEYTRYYIHYLHRSYTEADIIKICQNANAPPNLVKELILAFKNTLPMSFSPDSFTHAPSLESKLRQIIDYRSQSSSDLFAKNPDSLPLVKNLNSYDIHSIVSEVLKINDYLKTVEEPFIVLAPGRSPIFHAQALKYLREGVFSFAFSGRCYTDGIMPTQPQLNTFRQYLQEVGLTPALLLKVNKIFFLDFVRTGATITSLIHLLAHWICDFERNTQSAAEEWIKDPEKKRYEESIRQKLVIMGEHPFLYREGDIQSTVSGPQFSGYLFKNAFPVLLPYYPVPFWEYPLSRGMAHDSSDPSHNPLAKACLWYFEAALKNHNSVATAIEQRMNKSPEHVTRGFAH